MRRPAQKQPPVTIAPISVLAIAISFPEIPCHTLSPSADRDWTEKTWIQSCKTSGFDHDIIRSSALMPNPSLLKIGFVMDATDLKVFEAVARHGSMNRAAGELNTVQSNVTARVRALELELEVPLFQPHALAMKPHHAGRPRLPLSAGKSRS